MFDRNHATKVRSLSMRISVTLVELAILRRLEVRLRSVNYFCCDYQFRDFDLSFLVSCGQARVVVILGSGFGFNSELE